MKTTSNPRLYVAALVAALSVAMALPASAKSEKAKAPQLPTRSSETAQQATTGDSGAGGGGSTDVQRPPLDYISQASKLSPAAYPKTIKQVVELPMADGETIYLEIVRPDPAQYPDLGKVPVILEASPYHGTIATRIGDRIFPDPRDANGNMIGLTGYFAPRGYAVVMMDLRGTGRSTGCLDQLGPKDASDMKEVIEWLATRDWSTGRIGMTGHSYVGSTPKVAAAMRPKGLVTIAPSAGLASMYDHQFQKGSPYLLQWAGPQWSYELLAMMRDLPPGYQENVLTGSPTGDNWGHRGGPNPQTGCGWQNSAFTAGSGQITGQYERWHGQRDWRQGATDADIPVFMIHGVNDQAARIPAAEWFFDGRYRREGDKVWLGQWDHGSTNGRCGDRSNSRVTHPTCRFSQWQYALHAWFDHHLQQRTWVDAEGNVHPIDTGPAVEVFLNGVNPIEIGNPSTPTGTPRDPATWGTKVFTDSTWRKFPKIELYPDATDMTLKAQRPAEEAKVSYSGTDAFTILAAAPKVHVGANPVFRSAPMEEDSLFVGLPRLQLEASVLNSQIVDITAVLYRRSGSQREPMNVCSIRPMFRNGVHDVAPVIPGERMTLPLQCFTMAHWVAKGQTIELELSTTTRHHASTGSEQQVTVYTGGSNGTRYLPPKVPSFTLYDDVRLRA